LIKSLQEFKIERLNEFNGKMYATDLMQIEFSLSNAGNTFHGSYEVFGSKTQPVMDLQNLMRQFITKIVTQNKSISQTETNINIKEIEPLASSRISEMFERIMNDEEIDLKLIYQSLIGPQTALKANAA